MKAEKIAGLRTCPVCGHQAIMRKNASKRFQIHCRKCACCTPWTSKIDCVVRWYNYAKIYEDLNGITPPLPGKTIEERLCDASENLKLLVEDLKTGGLINTNSLEKVATEILKITKE